MNQIQATPSLSIAYRLSDLELRNADARYLRAVTELSGLGVFTDEAAIRRWVDALADRQLGTPLSPSNRAWFETQEAALLKVVSPIAISAKPDVGGDSTLAALQRKREGLLAEMKATLAGMDARAAELAAIRAPLGAMIEERARLLSLINTNAQHREKFSAVAAEFAAQVDECMRASDGCSGLLSLFARDPYRSWASAGVAAVDTWTATSRARIAKLDGAILDYARAHLDDVRDLLPAELCGRLEVTPVPAS